MKTNIFLHNSEELEEAKLEHIMNNCVDVYNLWLPKNSENKKSQKHYCDTDTKTLSTSKNLSVRFDRKIYNGNKISYNVKTNKYTLSEGYYYFICSANTKGIGQINLSPIMELNFNDANYESHCQFKYIKVDSSITFTPLICSLDGEEIYVKNFTLLMEND